MGQPFKITLNSINNGQQAQEDFPIEGGYNFSIAIDTDAPANLDETVSLSSGMITPVTFAVDSGFDGVSGINEPVIDIFIPGVEDSTRMYTVTRDGKVVRCLAIGDALSSFSEVADFTGEPTGAIYYKDFIYAFGTTSNNDDVAKYGPLTGTPVVTNNAWTADFSLTELNDDFFLPQIDNVEQAKHWAYHHVDDAVYFADYVDGKGTVHKLKTTSDGTNDGSAYNVLDLPSGYKITSFTGYGNDLVIGAMKWNDAGSSSGAIAEPALFFWDTISDSFYKVVEIPEWSVLTALINKGGTIYVFGGTNDDGHGIGVFDGAQGVTQLAFLPYGHSPYAGAVAIYGERIVWGSREPNSSNNAVLYAMGDKDPRVSTTAIQCVGKANLHTGDMLITAIIYPYQDSGIFPKIVMGTFSDDNPVGNDTALEQVDSSATQNSVIEFGQFSIGQPFRIDKIRLPLGEAVASGVIITPSLLIDDRQDTYTLPIINNTNYPAKRNIIFKKTRAV